MKEAEKIKKILHEGDRVIALHEKGKEYTSLTFLLSDGETLWAYRDFNENYKKGDYTIEELDEYYTLNYANGEFGFVVCSETLRMTGLEWNGMVNGELIAVNRKGKMVVKEFL